MLIATLLVATQMLYVASKPTFGCSSIEEVRALDRLRSDPKAFQTELYEQIFTGQCVEIGKGKVVEGSGSATSPSVLLIDRRIQPPGFLVPLRDFRRFKPVSSRNRIDAGHAAARE